MRNKFRAGVFVKKSRMPGVRPRHEYLSFISAALTLLVSGVEHACAENDKNKVVHNERPTAPARAVFNPNFILNSGKQEIDLSRYVDGNPLLPGRYRLDVYLNGRYISKESIQVKDVNAQSIICLSDELLKSLDINTDDFSTADKAQRLVDDCLPKALMGNINTEIDLSKLTMNVSVPQSMLINKPRGYVDPAQWSSGVTSGLLNYDFSTYRSQVHGHTSQSYYGGLRGGLNFGEWIFRHTGALSSGTEGGIAYASTRNYFQRDITPWRSSLILGDASTSGELFDSFSYRGIQLATNDRMLPDSLRGYAPVVRGIAKSSARVSIKQNGMLLLERSVPPGEFVIDDLFPTGYGGDLEVTIQEADGSSQVFRLPYSSVAQLLRPGVSKYTMMLGHLRGQESPGNAPIIQGTYQLGWLNGFTPYAGLLAAREYSAYLMGGAFDTPLGGVSLDITKSMASVAGEQRAGHSLRLTYSKLLQTTNSALTVAAYRFSSGNYLNLSDALSINERYKAGDDNRSFDTYQRVRSRLSLTANQPLYEGFGQLYMSGFTQNYWASSGSSQQFQLGYNNTYKKFSYSVSASKGKTLYDESDNQLTLSFSMPLGGPSTARMLSFNVTSDSSGSTQQAMLSESLGAFSQGSYSVSALSDSSGEKSLDMSTSYRLPYAALQAGYGQSNYYNSQNLGISGSLVAHASGVTASSYGGETMALISAPGAAGARLSSYNDIRLNADGFAIMPYLSPYRMNEISLDPQGIPDDVELQATSQKVAPRFGAVVAANYQTVSGQAVLIKLRRSNGKLPPFGATVRNADGVYIGDVGQAGKVYARISTKGERLSIRWGKDEMNTCNFVIDLSAPKYAKPSKMVVYDAMCEE